MSPYFEDAVLYTMYIPCISVCRCVYLCGLVFLFAVSIVFVSTLKVSLLLYAWCVCMQRSHFSISHLTFILYQMLWSVIHTWQVPYRDSKITRLFQDALSGWGNTVMIANTSMNPRSGSGWIAILSCAVPPSIRTRCNVVCIYMCVCVRDICFKLFVEFILFRSVLSGFVLSCSVLFCSVLLCFVLCWHT